MIRATSICMALALLPFAVLTVPSSPVSIVLEAEGYADIQDPMLVVRGVEEASGGAYVELPLGAGQGWRGEGGGRIVYKVDVEREDDYRVWARVKWQDGCTNAFFMSANNQPNVVLGNDAIFEQWHWVKGQSVSLKKGVNQLTFSNHSDGTALDKLIITNDPLYLPDGLGKDITGFYDGFAGCDADNTGSWETASGRWRVVKGIDEASGGVNDCLAQWSPEGGVTLGGFSVWENYDIRMQTMLSGPGEVGIIFYRSDSDNEYRLVWAAGEDESRMTLEQAVSGRVNILAMAPTPRGHFDRWYELGFRIDEETLVCMLDGEEILTHGFGGDRRGQIGLLTRNSGGIYFDNVEVSFDK